LKYEGRIYLSKDARMSKKVFWESYPGAKRFQKVAKKYNPDLKFKSLLSQRLSILE